MEKHLTREDVVEKIIKRSATDIDFRNKLIKDPKSTIEKSLNLTIPDSINIHIHQEDANNIHLILPSADNQELKVDELKNIAGGFCYAWPPY